MTREAAVEKRGAMWPGRICVAVTLVSVIAACSKPSARDDGDAPAPLPKANALAADRPEAEEPEAEEPDAGDCRYGALVAVSTLGFAVADAVSGAPVCADEVSAETPAGRRLALRLSDRRLCSYNSFEGDPGPVILKVAHPGYAPAQATIQLELRDCRVRGTNDDLVIKLHPLDAGR